MEHTNNSADIRAAIGDLDRALMLLREEVQRWEDDTLLSLLGDVDYYLNEVKYATDNGY